MKTMIRVSNHIEIKMDTLPPKTKDAICKELTLLNPVYVQAERMDKYTGHLEKYIYLYESRGDTIIIPRGFVGRLFKLLKDAGQEYQVDDQRLLLPSVDYHSKIKLRGYQTPAAEKLIKFGNGGLVAPCGSGKTQMMLEVMARLQQPSLWITHTRELVEQLIERACLCFDGMDRAEIGVIAAGKISIGPRLTVALVQTLSKEKLEGITDKFGAVFIDEAQHLPSSSFLVPIGQFPARYRLWCTATPTREDGLSEVITIAGGPILYTVQDEDLPTIKPRLQIIETSYIGYTDASDFSGMMGSLVSNAERNALITDVVAREASGHYSLVLSDRIEHLEKLKVLLVDRLPEMAIEILNGQLPKKERTAIMERAKTQQIDILLATKLAREGLDLPALDRLFLVTPKAAAGAIQQEVGRIMRPCDNKLDAVIFDFWDASNPIFKAQFWKRREVYERLGIAVDMKTGIQRISK